MKTIGNVFRNQQVVSSSLTVGSIVPIPSPIDELSSISTALVVTPQSSVQGGPPRPQDASLEGPDGAAATFCAVKPGNPHCEGKQWRYTWSLKEIKD
jgi:hypothetical protein